MRFIGAHAGNAAPRTWPTDDRYVVLPRAGIVGVARGRGPTYGGHHYPVHVDLALQATVDALVVAPPRTESSLKAAITEAHSTLVPSDPNAYIQRLQHTAWTITVVALSNDHAVLGHVGVCRAYLWQRETLRLLTTDHSLEAFMIEEGKSEDMSFFRYTESRVLGIQEVPEIDTSTFPIAEGDSILLLTPGVWASVEPDELQDLVRSTIRNPTALVEALLQRSAKNAGLGATAVVASVAPPTESTP